MSPFPVGPFAVGTLVGGSGGSEFTTCGWVAKKSSLVVTRLDVWYTTGALSAVQVGYADGSSSNVFGSTAGASQATVTFAPGDTVTSLILYGNGETDPKQRRCGHIYLTTSGGKTLDVGRDTKNLPAYDVSLGSGILVGVCGRSGLEVDLLGAVFLKYAVVSVSVSDIVYSPDLSGTSDGITTVVLAEELFQNTSPNDTKDYSFRGTSERNVGTTFAQAAATTFGTSIPVQVSAAPYIVATNSAGVYQWQSGATVTTSTVTTGSVTLSWDATVALQPGEGAFATANVEKGVGTTGYNSSVTVKLSDGTTNTYPEEGQFSDVAYGKAFVTTTAVTDYIDIVVDKFEHFTVPEPWNHNGIAEHGVN